MRWLALTLLVPVGLLGLLLLMEWLERTHTRQLIVDDVTEFLTRDVAADQVEAAVAQHAAPLVENTFR